MLGAEQRDLRYLFKLKQSNHVKKLIAQFFNQEDWVEAGQKWEGRIDELLEQGAAGGGVAETAAEPTGSENGDCRQEQDQTQGWQTDDVGSAGGQLQGRAI